MGGLLYAGHDQDMMTMHGLQLQLTHMYFKLQQLWPMQLQAGTTGARIIMISDMPARCIVPVSLPQLQAITSAGQ